ARGDSGPGLWLRRLRQRSPAELLGPQSLDGRLGDLGTGDDAVPEPADLPADRVGDEVGQALRGAGRQSTQSPRRRTSAPPDSKPCSRAPASAGSRATWASRSMT